MNYKFGNQCIYPLFFNWLECLFYLKNTNICRDLWICNGDTPVILSSCVLKYSWRIINNNSILCTVYKETEQGNELIYDDYLALQSVSVSGIIWKYNPQCPIVWNTTGNYLYLLYKSCIGKTPSVYIVSYAQEHMLYNIEDAYTYTTPGPDLLQTVNRQITTLDWIDVYRNMFNVPIYKASSPVGTYTQIYNF